MTVPGLGDDGGLSARRLHEAAAGWKPTLFYLIFLVIAIFLKIRDSCLFLLRHWQAYRCPEKPFLKNSGFVGRQR
jgi:hypothetical protein